MATVLEIPLEMPQPGRQVKRGSQCIRLRANGLQCRMPAVEGHDYCLRHEMWYNLVPAVLGMPYPEDAVSLQEVMARTLDLLLSRRITPAMASAIERLCRLMMKNLSRYREEMQAAEDEYWDRPRVRKLEIVK